MNRRARKLIAAVHKDLRPWVRTAQAAGWELDARGKHLTLKSPDGYRCPVPSNANNRLRTVFRDQLAKHGVDLGDVH